MHHLRYFVAVAERLHFSEAAEFVHVSQPGLSQQIKALEEGLGVLLLDRTKRTVHVAEKKEANSLDLRLVTAYDVHGAALYQARRRTDDDLIRFR